MLNFFVQIAKSRGEAMTTVLATRSFQRETSLSNIHLDICLNSLDCLVGMFVVVCQRSVHLQWHEE